MTESRRGRLVHVHKITGVSGSERHLLTLLPRLARDGYDVTMVALGDDRVEAVRRAQHDFGTALSRAGVSVETVRLRADLDPWCLRDLVRVVRASRCDIVHTHLVHADVYGACAARLCGTALVSTRHNDDAFRRRWLSMALHRCLGGAADRLITISEALKRFVVDTEGVSPEKIKRIYYGLDATSPVITRPRSEAAGRVIGAVGRLSVQKGHRYLLEAFARVLHKYEDVRLVIVGDGPLREELMAHARRLGVADVVRFAGYEADAAALMHSFDVMVVPSLWEGFGLVLLEAMAAARPIVASRVSAIPEIVVDGETGVLVPPADAGLLADAIVSVLDDPDRAERMGAHGRARLTQMFSVGAMVTGTEAVYDEVIARARRRT